MAVPARMVKVDCSRMATTASLESTSAPSSTSLPEAGSAASSVSDEPPSKRNMPAVLPPSRGKPAAREMVAAPVARRVMARPASSTTGSAMAMSPATSTTSPVWAACTAALSVSNAMRAPSRTMAIGAREESAEPSDAVSSESEGVVGVAGAPSASASSVPSVSCSVSAAGEAASSVWAVSGRAGEAGAACASAPGSARLAARTVPRTAGAIGLGIAVSFRSRAQGGVGSLQAGAFVK